MSRIIMPSKPQEIQIHMAITLVGDRLHPIKEYREDKEVKQWAARFLQKQYGNITNAQLEKVFVEFYESVQQEMRRLNALRSGQ